MTDVLGLGPAGSVSAFAPDLHHFSGRGGKDVIPLYRDANASQANVTHDLLDTVGRTLGEAVTAEDFVAYCYALLTSPAYVEKFSEDLTVPGPRIPITKDAGLFRRAKDVGQKLIWLHTFGERFVPSGQRTREVPQGRARCVRGISDEPDRYPEKFSYSVSTPELLLVGDGEFAPVREDVWQFSLSGFQVLYSWLSYRMKAGAGRQSSPLDEIRPERWTASMTQELLEVLWVIEGTIDLFPELEALFNDIIAGQTYAASELPQPTPEERRPPSEEEDSAQQTFEM